MIHEKEFPESISEIKELVKRQMLEKVPATVNNWTFESGGCETGNTFRRNIDAFQSLGFRIKTLEGVKLNDVDITKKFLGDKYRMPLAVAPFGAGIRNLCDEPFIEIAKGCDSFGIPSSIGYPNESEKSKKMIEINRSLFRIIKPLKDRERLKNELELSEKIGCIATGIDVDSIAGLKPNGDKLVVDICEPITKKELKQLIEYVNIPFIVKGIMDGEEAEACLKAGAQAIVVSNHTGSAMDYCLSPLEVLPSIKERIADEMDVYMDSGITRGSDVLKALCLGADAILLGRLTLWGLALGGAKGLEWILEILEKEIKRNMVLLGKRNLKELSTDCLLPLNSLGESILD